MKKFVALEVARIKRDHIYWYVPSYIPSIQQHGKLSKQFLSKTPTELRYIERFVFFLKEIINQNPWNIELGSQESVPTWTIRGFQQRDR